jgi:hypothetical protein
VHHVFTPGRFVLLRVGCANSFAGDLLWLRFDCPAPMSALSVIDFALQDGRPCDHPTNCTRLEEILDFIKDQRQSREGD